LLRRTPLHAFSRFLTATPSSLSTHNQMYYRIMNSYHSISSTNTTQCSLYFPLYTVCRYSERLLHCTFCSVFCEFRHEQCCCVCELTKFEVFMKNTVWYVVTS
jgi:hypothetical protein